MTRFDIHLCSQVPRTFRLAALEGTFGLECAEMSRERIEAEVPALEESWRIGAIMGPSGSGKTTLAKAAFSRGFRDILPWRGDVAMIDGLPDRPLAELMSLLTSVGLGSPRIWTRPFHQLSSGEQFRAHLARALAAPVDEASHSVLVVDEFTSNVDRTTARSIAAAVGATLRRNPQLPRLVVVTCHHDIVPWLSPDWHVNLNSGSAVLERTRVARPTVKLEVERAPQSMWQQFRKHHYLHGDLGRSSSCYIAKWEGELAAFLAVVPQLGRAGQKRISRIVTLPQFQGLGIGMRLAEHVARELSARGHCVTITASHPGVIRRCSSSPHWKLQRYSRTGKAAPQQFYERTIASTIRRPSASFQYIGVVDSQPAARDENEVRS